MKEKMDEIGINMENLKVSRFTLRISNKSMQKDFIEYLRSETKKISLAVLIVMIIITLMITALY